MRISDLFFFLAPPHVRVHHFAHDGPGPDDRDLHDQIVKMCRRIVRNGSHLRAALHLKHAHSIGLAQRLIDRADLQAVRQDRPVCR